MRHRLLAAGLFALGACDAASPSSADSANAAEVTDAAAASTKDPARDAALVDGSLRVDAARLVDAAALADATLIADAAPIADDAPTDAAQHNDAGHAWPLGMNDVSILTPLPANMNSPVLLRGTDVGQDGAPLIPKDLYDRVSAPTCFVGGTSPCDGVEVPVLAPRTYERFHLVALRFDLCDRNLPGTCADGEDGRLRLVWQPMESDTFFSDAGLHAFFSIPSAELRSALATLRELARLQGAPATSPLAVSPGLSDPGKPEYAEGLRAFVRAHAQRARLVRLTMIAQPGGFAQVRWLAGGIERRADGLFHEIVIPGTTVTRQDVILHGRGFEVRPAVDVPTGLAGVLLPSVYEAASPDAQMAMLEALAAIDHPARFAPDSASCVACHTSTSLHGMRAPGLAAPNVRGAYVTSHNVSIEAASMNGPRITVRAFGYATQTPVISRRVAHETAQVLTEIEQRFP